MISKEISLYFRLAIRHISEQILDYSRESLDLNALLYSQLLNNELDTPQSLLRPQHTL